MNKKKSNYQMTIPVRYINGASITVPIYAMNPKKWPKYKWHFNKRYKFAYVFCNEAFTLYINRGTKRQFLKWKAQYPDISLIP